MLESCKIFYRLAFSFIGIVAGISAFFVFSFAYGNLHAGVWGLISGVFATVCFHLHYLNYKQDLDNWHSVETLSGLKVLGTLGLLGGLSAFTWYIFTAIYHAIPLMPIGDSAYIAAVWAFLTVKWAFSLIFYARMYIRDFQRENPRLIRL